MKIGTLVNILEREVPSHTAESWDNVGLLIGDTSTEVSGIMTALDCTMEVVEEAIASNCNTIICHHPLIFSGIKSIINQGQGAIIHKIIQQKMNVIAMHTNLDKHPQGVNAMLATTLGLENQRLLCTEQEAYYKVQVFIPEENAEAFKAGIVAEGYATEGEYESVFFNARGKGQFKPVGDANPHIGALGEVTYVDELKIEFMIRAEAKAHVTQLIEQLHPYETPVYDFIALERTAPFGLGMMGELPEAMSVSSFVQQAKSNLDMPSVRFIGNRHAQIKTVALVGGAGVGEAYHAASKGADLFVTGDVKHHEALDAKIDGINILDINHYGEYVMKKGLKTLLGTWLSGHDVHIEASTAHTDPYDYM